MPADDPPSSPPRAGRVPPRPSSSPRRARSRLLPTPSSPRPSRGSSVASVESNATMEDRAMPISQSASSYHTGQSNLTPRQFDMESTTKSSKSTKSTKSTATSASSRSRRHAPPPPVRGAIADDTKSVWSVLRSQKGSLRSPAPLPPSLSRRLRDFNYAYSKRLNAAGESPAAFGIFGLYDHLSAIRLAVDWAEDASHRRQHDLPYLTFKDYKEGTLAPWYEELCLFTWSLIIVCCSLMVWEFGVNGWSVAPLSENPMIGVSMSTLVECGARVTSLIVLDGQVWRLLSATFLHSGLVHLLFNMSVLYFVGRGLERAHGAPTVLLIFLVGGVGGNVLSALFLPQYVSVGASGGIFSLLGATLADIVMNWGLIFSEAVPRTEKEKRQHKWVLILLVLDILINICIGFVPFVDNFCHCGGLLLGFLLGLAAIDRLRWEFFGRERSFWAKAYVALVRTWSLVLVAAILTGSTAWLFVCDGYTSPCNACRAASCLSMPFWTDPNDRWWYCDDCAGAYGLATWSDELGGYWECDMTCPSKVEVTFQLDEVVEDIAVLDADMPGYCREYCEGDAVYYQHH